jgi:hypothetical protein
MVGGGMRAQVSRNAASAGVLRAQEESSLSLPHQKGEEEEASGTHALHAKHNPRGIVAVASSPSPHPQRLTRCRLIKKCAATTNKTAATTSCHGPTTSKRLLLLSCEVRVRLSETA